MIPYLHGVIGLDEKTTIHKLKQKVKHFCKARDWDQFHNAKELAIGIVTEAGELLQPLRFKSEEQMKELFSDESKKNEISLELADVLYFTLRFAQMNDINLATALDRVLEKNETNYPVNMTKGSNLKRNEY